MPKFKIEVQISYRAANFKSMKDAADICQSTGRVKPPESETEQENPTSNVGNEKRRPESPLN